MAPHVPEVLALWREATVGEKHVHRTDDDNIIIKPTLGTSRSYTLSRLKREAFKNSGTKKNRAPNRGPAQSQSATRTVQLLFVERQDGGNQLGSAALVVIVRLKVFQDRRAVLINAVGVPVEGDIGAFDDIFP
jgi:hypothetical protein